MPATLEDVDFDRPFLGSRALAAGHLTDNDLRRDFVRVFRNVYVPRGVVVDARIKAEAAWLFAGPDAVLAGKSAAVVHGSKWVDDSEPAEVIRVGHLRTPRGLRTHDYVLEPDEAMMVDGMAVTTPERTAFDLGRRHPARWAVAVLDALANATNVKMLDVALLAERHRGARGIVQLRDILEDVDGGAESPQETYTRLKLVNAGLPRPETQIVITDSAGRIVARADLGWKRYRVLVEYDGEQHWTDRDQRAWDIDRTVLLEELGWTVIRVSAQLLHERPYELIRRVRAALLANGWLPG